MTQHCVYDLLSSTVATLFLPACFVSRLSSWSLDVWAWKSQAIRCSQQQGTSGECRFITGNDEACSLLCHLLSRRLFHPKIKAKSLVLCFPRPCSTCGSIFVLLICSSQWVLKMPNSFENPMSECWKGPFININNIFGIHGVEGIKLGHY